MKDRVQGMLSGPMSASVLQPGPACLPIACAIDEAYALPLAVMLESLKERLRPGFRPMLYLLHRGLPRPVLEAVSSLVETHSIVPYRGATLPNPAGLPLPP